MPTECRPSASTPGSAPSPKIRKKTIARMRSGTARQITTNVRALPRATSPVVVFQAASTATGRERTTDSRVASVTMARVWRVREELADRWEVQREDALRERLRVGGAVGEARDVDPQLERRPDRRGKKKPEHDERGADGPRARWWLRQRELRRGEVGESTVRVMTRVP